MVTDIGTRGRAFLRRQENAALNARKNNAAWYSRRVRQASRWYHQVWKEHRSTHE